LSFSAYRSFWYLQVHGVPFTSLAGKFGNYPPEFTNDLLYEAQSVYFFTLIVMQWGYVSLPSHKKEGEDLTVTFFVQ